MVLVTGPSDVIGGSILFVSMGGRRRCGETHDPKEMAKDVTKRGTGKKVVPLAKLVKSK